MSIQEKRIRNRVAEELRGVDGLPSRVFAARHRAIGSSLMPCLTVYKDGGHVVSTTSVGNGARKYERQFELRIGVLLNADGKNDPGHHMADRLDELGELVESWMFAHEEWEGVWVEALLSRTETGTPQESKEPTVVRLLVFDVTYFDFAPKLASVDPEPLETVHVDQDLVTPDGQVDASDTISIPQP